MVGSSASCTSRLLRYILHSIFLSKSAKPDELGSTDKCSSPTDIYYSIRGVRRRAGLDHSQTERAPTERFFDSVSTQGCSKLIITCMLHERDASRNGATKVRHCPTSLRLHPMSRVFMLHVSLLFMISIQSNGWAITELSRPFIMKSRHVRV